MSFLYRFNSNDKESDIFFQKAEKQSNFLFENEETQKLNAMCEPELDPGPEWEKK